VVLATIAAMPVSGLSRAKRAFVSVLLYVAASYGVVVKVNRDTADGSLPPSGVEGAPRQGW
jgi:hypothetical protein